MSAEWQQQSSLENLVEQLRYQETSEGSVYLIAPSGPLFWTTSKTKAEALQKLLTRIRGDG